MDQSLSPTPCPRPLPPEVKAMIVDYLWDDQLTLARLVASDKAFYFMAIDHLYSNVSLGTPPLNKIIHSDVAYQVDRRGIERFLVTVLRRPDLQICTTSLDVTNLHDLCWMHRKWLIDHTNRPYNFPRLSAQDRMIIVRAIRDAPFTERLKKDLTDELMLRVPRSDALLAVLLASLPNLERLEIAIENPGLYLFLPREANLFERALGTPAGVTAVYTDGQPDGQRTLLPKLWQLKAEVAGDSPAGNIIALKQIVQLRKVTHFYGVRWSRPLRSPANLHGDLSNLVYIELRECVFPNHVTERLFSGAFNLSTLIYQRGWNWNHDMTHFVGTRSLRLALRPLGGTLTCLELSFNRSGRNSQETLFVRPINLWFLYCLKRLRISAGHLVTSARKEHMINRHHESFWDWEGTLNAGRPVRQLLPPRLEKLEIIQVEDRDEFNTLCDKLLSCLAYRASPEFNQTRELESLKEIVLEHQFEDQSPRLVKLHEAADRVGVKLITLHNCVESTTTGITRPVRADKEIDWGFDREVKWKHPFIWKDEVVVKTP